MIEGAFKFPFVMRGKIEESAKNKLDSPLTLQSFSTTVVGSFLSPILHVPHG